MQTSPSRKCGKTLGEIAISWLIPLLVAVGMTIGSVAWQHGGILHPEIERRLPYYLSRGPLLAKLYDSGYLDDGMYQARELSYFFDYIDCRFIAWCVALGHPHFLSLTHYVFLILISLVLWRFGVVDLKLHPGIALGVLLLFWTTPAVFLGGTFFRTAKIGVALTMVVLYRYLFRLVRTARENPGETPSVGTGLACFGLAWAATLFDREGVFMVAGILVFLGFWFLSYRGKIALKLVVVFAAALTLSILYNYIAAPLLTLSINNYWPDFKYQHLPWGDLAARPLHFITAAFSLYFDTVRFFLGNIPSWTAAVVVAGLAGGALITGWRKGQAAFSAAVGTIVSLTALPWLMMLLMALRHVALVWPEVRRVYYFLPVVSIFAMTLLMLLPRRAGWGMAVLLSAGLIGNALALPRDEAIFRAGQGRDCYESTPVLIDALRDLHNPAHVVSGEVTGNRVYQFFSGQRFSKGNRPFTPPKN